MGNLNDSVPFIGSIKLLVNPKNTKNRAQILPRSVVGVISTPSSKQLGIWTIPPIIFTIILYNNKNIFYWLEFSVKAYLVRSKVNSLRHVLINI
jgi:hypothetical protein